ncbi:Ubiquitin-like-conjugating enzyme ATG10 [Frankliniella fusca]|uniref:Ubiquitin-like-conjugating enzyme ATG10 n=1 Tax=Frankliniella fusca TaxID=407009 RepID=A0AAE1L762_9NEOP|nr:Ubiquitin-like-conjugating enzyme ATG10 [Frankliniella fusca]
MPVRQDSTGAAVLRAAAWSSDESGESARCVYQPLEIRKRVSPTQLFSSSTLIGCMTGWTISWEDFLSNMVDFMALSDEIGDSWMWQGDKKILGGAYLMKKVKLQMPRTFDHHEEDCKIEHHEYMHLQDIQETENILVHPQTYTECIWEYHILYSISYASPVLYFNAFFNDGRLLPLEALWNGSGSENQVLKHMRWEALSQQEHPILRRPFYQLHPCKTAEFLSHHKGSRQV